MLKDYFKKLYTGTQADFFDRACQAMDQEKKAVCDYRQSRDHDDWRTNAGI